VGNVLGQQQQYKPLMNTNRMTGERYCPGISFLASKIATVVHSFTCPRVVKKARTEVRAL
jgi:hypothetical protein